MDNDSPQRPVPTVLGWTAAALVAVLVAWVGISVVTNAVTDDRPAALSTADISRNLGEIDGSSTSAPAPFGDSSTTVSDSDEDRDDRDASSGSDDDPDDDPDDSGSDDSGSSSSGSSTTVARSSSSSTSPSTTTVRSGSSTSTSTTPTSSPPTTTVQASETRTYNVVGGEVALRFSPSGVTVVYATPAPGFGVDTEPEEGNGVRVDFENDSHRSRVKGWWAGGPQEEIREENR